MDGLEIIGQWERLLEGADPVSVRETEYDIYVSLCRHLLEDPNCPVDFFFFFLKHEERFLFNRHVIKATLNGELADLSKFMDKVGAREVISGQGSGA